LSQYRRELIVRKTRVVRDREKGGKEGEGGGQPPHKQNKGADKNARTGGESEAGDKKDRTRQTEGERPIIGEVRKHGRRGIKTTPVSTARMKARLFLFCGVLYSWCPASIKLLCTLRQLGEGKEESVLLA
jgi:hypothetical protein